MSGCEDGFKNLGLKRWLCQQCHGLGMKSPTLVQTNCVPAILQGKDCIGCAKTGSGKTAAFALPILNKLSEDPYGIFAVVLTPTRELAFQIKDQFAALGAHINVRVTTVVGGMDMLKQSLELSHKPHVIVATPGRLADHISSGEGVQLKRVKFLVLDEADRLFEPCFSPDLSTIISSLPAERQTLLFSATLTEAIEQLKGVSATTPHVYVAPAHVATVETLQQEYLLVPELMRNTALAHCLQGLVGEETRGGLVEEETCIVFTHSCKATQILSTGLKKLGFQCTALHSLLSQNTRLSSLAKFRCGVVKILVATDVASRGLDIPLVSCVINYNTPSSPTDYIHRVGRTARAGKGGRAVTIVTQYDIERLQAIERSIGVQLTERKMSDEDSVKILQPVSLAMREARLHLDTHGFGETRERNRRKAGKVEGNVDKRKWKAGEGSTEVSSTEVSKTGAGGHLTKLHSKSIPGSKSKVKLELKKQSVVKQPMSNVLSKKKKSIKKAKLNS